MHEGTIKTIGAIMLRIYRFNRGKVKARARGPRLNASPYLRHAKWNGEIITGLIDEVCAHELLKNALLIHTPTAGEWLGRISWPSHTKVTTLRYADHRQSHQADSSFMDRNSFVLEMKRMSRLNTRFDIIAIDPFHDYRASQLDLELCIDCLDRDGLLLSHDCAPSSAELAAPNFTPGNWCGTTYAALTVVALHHPELAVTVLDTDTGVGIVRRRSSRYRSHWLPPVELKKTKQEKFRSLCEAGQYKRAYKYFRDHGHKLVDLRRPTPTPTPQQTSQARQDCVEIPIQDGAHLLAFHKDLDFGRGPALSLYVHGLEVLKFDCFGPGVGHFHVQPHEATRLMMAERSMRGQVIRAVREIKINAELYVTWSTDASVGSFRFDKSALDQAAAKAKTLLMHYSALYERSVNA
jgi:hypothetical protein